MRRFVAFFVLASGCSTAGIGTVEGDGDDQTPQAPDANGNDPRPRPDARPAPDGGVAADAFVPMPDSPPGTVFVPVIDVHAMDVWAQYLPAGATLKVYKGSVELTDEKAFPVRRIALTPGDYRVHLEAPDHDPLDVGFRYDGSLGLDGVKLVSSTASRMAGVSLSHAREPGTPGKEYVVHRLFLGLRHKWFAASGRPARRGNAITLFLDHEEAWSEVNAEVRAARDTVNVTSWWFNSNFELVRSTSTSQTQAQRAQNTIMAALNSTQAVKRVLIGQFFTQDGVLKEHTTDQAIRDKGAAANDRFEYMGQANPSMGEFLFALDPFEMGERVRASHADLRGTYEPEQALVTNVPSHTVDMTDLPVDVSIPHASMHQKLVVVDDAVAFVGGLNFHPDDWDGPDHKVFDARRMEYGTSNEDRAKVAAKEMLPLHPPRKDYMMRIDGPAVVDVNDVFKKRWDLAIDEEVDYAQNASRFAPGDEPDPVGDVQVQITTTLPDPLWEHSIAESWLNAIAHAERYIYIEDQYFRAQILNDAIYARMLEVPSLRLVVISMPVSEWTDPACEWTAKSHMLFKDAFPDRYVALMMRSFDTVVTWGFDETESRFVDIYNHSKMLIIDDRFMSVGSANKNNRGMIYEAEMNVAVFDQTWVRAERRRILGDLLGGAAVSDDAGAWFRQLEQSRDANDAVYASWEAEGFDIDLDGDALPARYKPTGFLYDLPVRSSDHCLLEGVGPDVM